MMNNTTENYNEKEEEKCIIKDINDNFYEQYMEYDLEKDGFYISTGISDFIKEGLNKLGFNIYEKDKRSVIINKSICD